MSDPDDDDEDGRSREARVVEGINDAPELPPIESPDELPYGQWDGDVDSYCAWRTLNDLGNARRLQARFGQDCCSVHGLGWHAWHEGRWNREDGEDRAQVAAQNTANAIRGESRKLMGEHPERAKALLTHARRSGSSWAISAMLREARPHLNVPLAALDARPELANVKNGTMELDRDLRCRPHRREDYLTKLMPIRYDPDAGFPVFREFLATILPNVRVREFLQRWFGYCVTGYTHEQLIVMFHGAGANGKSTLLDTLRFVMGDYVQILPFASLLQDDRKRGSEPSPDIARLPGVRLVTASEPELGRAFSEAVIKTLTGESTILARHLREGFFEFAPQFKLVVSCNNRPKVRGQDEGTWRRLLLVPFDQTIPPEERDKRLLQRLRAEAPGVLNWLLEGARLYLADGLNIPGEVRAATSDYRIESDPLRPFLSEWCVRGPGVGNVRAKRLYRAYVLWCDEQARDPISQTRFGLSLGDMGVAKWLSNGVYYLDIALNEMAAAIVEADDARRNEHGGHRAAVPAENG
ncbi:MAG: hypothetical protein IPK66_08155 [Rhodospirillales bacterium]|nr:hypothetical protein [Rhodospirillales bacterium]